MQVGFRGNQGRGGITFCPSSLLTPPQPWPIPFHTTAPPESNRMNSGGKMSSILAPWAPALVKRSGPTQIFPLMPPSHLAHKLKLLLATIACLHRDMSIMSTQDVSPAFPSITISASRPNSERHQAGSSEKKKKAAPGTRARTNSKAFR